MLKKLLLASIISSVSFSSYAADFSNVTPDTYATYVSQGAAFKSNGNQENPDLYGRQWRKATTNSISIVTPRTITSYLSYSAQKRLVQLPTNLEQIIEQNNNLLYITTWIPFMRDGGNMFGFDGAIAPQLQTQRLAIEKNGTLIYPSEMPSEIEALMPHSFGVKYYAFPRATVMNVPYTIRWVTGYGDILSMDVTQETINNLIDDESHFYNAK